MFNQRGFLWDFFLTELDKMRKQMEEDIRAQLMANQAMLAENDQSWDDKVCSSTVKFTLNTNIQSICSE